MVLCFDDADFYMSLLKIFICFQIQQHVFMFIAENDRDDSQLLILRNMVRFELVSQGLDKLSASDGLTAIPFLQVCVQCSAPNASIPSYVYEHTCKMVLRIPHIYCCKRLTIFR